MTYTRVSERWAKIAIRIVQSSRLAALAILASFTSLAMQPAHAQSADTWKSVAIIGGSTAAGAYIGHKVAGSTGTLVGAAVGASTGYAIDRRRRANQYYNQYAYGDGGYYGNNAPYNGNGNPYYNNGGYDGGNLSQYPTRYQSDTYNGSRNRSCSRR